MARGVNPFGLNTSKTAVDVVMAAGGLDFTSPPVSVVPGSLLAGQNFVAVQSGGYRRIEGYERFDGSAAPSEAKYFSVILDSSFSTQPSSVTIGSKTFTVLGGDDEELYLLGESDGVSVGSSVSFASETRTVLEISGAGASDPKRHAEIKYNAAEKVRKNITAPPGVGAILAVLPSPDGSVLAFRANTDGKVEAYKSSPSGWVPVTRAIHLPFNKGSSEIKVGDTITGASSGATAKVDDILLVTGAFNPSTPATGVLVISGVNGTFSSGEDIKVGSTVKAKTTDTQAQVQIPPNLNPDGVVYNFKGGSGTDNLYFVDGVSKYIYRFDGNKIVATPITIKGDSGLSCILAEKSRLYIAYKASLFISAPGEPFKFDAVDGAAEIGLGADITNIVPARGSSSSGAIIITTDKSIYVLYGNDETDWRLQIISTDIGALPRTAANVNGDIMFASSSGIYTVEAVMQYGNFSVNSVSSTIKPLYKSLIPLLMRAVVRADRSEYRLYCSDGSVLVGTQVSRVSDTGAILRSLAFTFVSYKDYDTEAFIYNGVCRVVSGTSERFFVAGADYVYELDKGTSFDGRKIFAYLITAFFHSNSILVRKRYKSLLIAAISEGYSEAFVQYDVSPSAYDGGISRDLIVKLFPQGTWYDTSNWGTFVWSAGATPEVRLDTPGTGKAMSLAVKSISAISDPFTIQSFTIRYTVGRLER